MSAFTGTISGWAAYSHDGGVAVGVARSTEIPLRCNRSMTRSNHVHSNAPSATSRAPQLNTPRVTMFTPASVMRRTSSSHTSGDHCSGL
ncbi:MAG: hypothetical protein ABIQ18_21745 [Umezawaea sp.]